jgi:hypothetical protein
MTITLESIKTEQKRLGDLIEAFEAQAAATAEFHFPEAVIELAQGEHYAGLIIAKDGEPSYHLILLPEEKDNISWENAWKWAQAKHGNLPTRREQSLLYANLKDQFKPEAYWSSETHADDDGWAWYQYFSYGDQGSTRKDLTLRARAVRRLIIE